MISFINCFFDRHFCFLWRKIKKTRQRGVNVYKNITKSNNMLVKQLLMKNELIFDISMLCLYALWFRRYFNDIEKENLP